VRAAVVSTLCLGLLGAACSRTGLAVAASSDGGADASVEGVDAGCVLRPPHAMVPDCDDDAFWALEPTRCFDTGFCPSCLTSGSQPFAPLCFALDEETEPGRPLRVCYRERVEGGAWRVGEVPAPSGDGPLEVRGWLPIEPIELEYRPVFATGDVSRWAFSVDRRDCPDPRNPGLVCLGLPRRRARAHPRTITAVTRRGHFVDVAGETPWGPVASGPVTRAVDVDWIAMAFIDDDALVVVWPPRERGDPPRVVREALPGDEPTRLVASEHEILVTRGRRVLAYSVVSSEPRILPLGDHRLEGTPDDLELVLREGFAEQLAYRVGDRVHLRSLRSLEDPIEVDPRLGSAVRRLVQGRSEIGSPRLWALTADRLHAFDLVGDALSGSDQPSLPLRVDAERLIGVTSDGRQLATDAVGVVDNPFGLERLDLNAYFGGEVTARALFVDFGHYNVQGAVAVSREGQSVVFVVGEVHPDACGI